MWASCNICFNYKVKKWQVIKKHNGIRIYKGEPDAEGFTKEVTYSVRYAAAIVEWEATGEKYRKDSGVEMFRTVAISESENEMYKWCKITLQ